MLHAWSDLFSAVRTLLVFFTPLIFHVKSKQKDGWNVFLPVRFAEVLKVVHVAAGGRVLSVLRLPLLSVGDLQQVAVVLHDVITFLETLSGKHRPPLSFYVLDLRTGGWHMACRLKRPANYVPTRRQQWILKWVLGIYPHYRWVKRPERPTLPSFPPRFRWWWDHRWASFVPTGEARQLYLMSPFRHRVVQINRDKTLKHEVAQKNNGKYHIKRRNIKMLIELFTYQYHQFYRNTQLWRFMQKKEKNLQIHAGFALKCNCEFTTMFPKKW